MNNGKVAPEIPATADMKTKLVSTVNNERKQAKAVGFPRMAAPQLHSNPEVMASVITPKLIDKEQ